MPGLELGNHPSENGGLQSPPFSFWAGAEGATFAGIVASATLRAGASTIGRAYTRESGRKLVEVCVPKTDYVGGDMAIDADGRLCGDRAKSGEAAVVGMPWHRCCPLPWKVGGARIAGSPQQSTTRGAQADRERPLRFDGVNCHDAFLRQYDQKCTSPGLYRDHSPQAARTK